MDVENVQRDLASANEELEKRRQEIAELKFKLKFADELCVSHMAAFAGEERRFSR